MTLIKFNSFILVIYIYITSISLLLTPYINDFIVKTSFLLLLIVVILFINKFQITKNTLFFYLILILLIAINMLAVAHKDYVFADGVNFVMYSFIPIYLITQKLVSFTHIKRVWEQSAILFTFLLPIFYLYRQAGYISYYDIGFLSHLNILIIVYSMLTNNHKKNIFYIIYIIANFFVIAILGSRMVLVSSVFTCIVTFLLLSNKKSIKFYFNIITITILGIFVSLNLINILNYVNDVMVRNGIRSRNLSLFITQFSESYEDSTTLLSGRDNIYPVIIEHLLENGAFPSGLGVARSLTNGAFYHSHNFLMELFLIFGLFGFLLILVGFFVKVITLYKTRFIQENNTILNFLVILLTSFLIRSLTGTYFATDVTFLFCLGIILSIKVVKYK